MTNIFVNNRRSSNTYVGNRQRRSGKSTRTISTWTNRESITVTRKVLTNL